MSNVLLSQDDGYRELQAPDNNQTTGTVGIQLQADRDLPMAPLAAGDPVPASILRGGPSSHRELLNADKCHEVQPDRLDEEYDRYSDPGIAAGEGFGISIDKDLPSAGFNSVEEEKYHYLGKLGRAPERFRRRMLTAHHQLSEIRAEWERVSYDMDFEEDGALLKWSLTNLVRGTEMVNSFANPFPFRLTGWSATFDLDVQGGKYDRVLQRLHEKHRHRFRVGPEAELFRMVFMSGAMFHLSQILAGDMATKLNEPKFRDAVWKTYAAEGQRESENLSTQGPAPEADRQPRMAGPGAMFGLNPLAASAEVTMPVITSSRLPHVAEIQPEPQPDPDDSGSVRSFSTNGEVEIRVASDKKGKKQVKFSTAR